jgi:hypothetical protein
MNLREISTSAHRVLIGRIERLTSSRDAATGQIVSRLELAETRSLNGASLGSVSVDLVGGTSGGIRQWIAGFPTLNVGDSVIFFLAENTSTPLGPTVGLWQGVFFVEQDALGQEVVVDHLRRPLTEIRGDQVVAAPERLPRGAVTQAAPSRVTLDSFLTSIRSLRGAPNPNSDRR